MDVKLFKLAFKEKTHLGRDRVNDFFTWATGGERPPLTTREERGRGVHSKTVRASEGCRDEN